LLDAHHYTDGLAFLLNGTPSNNTADAPSGFSTLDPGQQESYSAERAGTDFTPGDGSNAEVLAAAFGLTGPNARAVAGLANGSVTEQRDAMHDIVTSGRAVYWGTSEWTAAEIAEAWHIADRRNMHKPVVEQPQYNLFHRERVEKEYARLYDDIGLGTTIWSPLASGLLTGKYNDGIPPDSRGTVKGYEWLAERLSDPAKIAVAKRLVPIAADVGCTLAQMSLAWCLMNPNVSTVITGASRPAQVVENMRALDVVPKLTPDVMARIDAALSGAQG